MASNFTIRLATLDDTETITAHRRAMFRETGYRDEKALEVMCAAFLPWVQRKMAEQEYVAWLAVAPDASVAAGIGLWLMDWPPRMIGPGARRANIPNV